MKLEGCKPDWPTTSSMHSMSQIPHNNSTQGNLQQLYRCRLCLHLKLSLTLPAGQQYHSAGSCSQPATCVLESAENRRCLRDSVCVPQVFFSPLCVSSTSSRLCIFRQASSLPLWKLTCGSGQVLHSGGLPCSRLSDQEDRLPLGDTHCQLFQQHSRGPGRSKRLVFPNHETNIERLTESESVC